MADEDFDLTSSLQLPAELMPYQWQGVRFLTDRASALLADGMGLGKSVQVCVALSVLARSGRLQRALIVCPASLRLNWEREIGRWSKSLSVRRIDGNKRDRIAQYRLPFNVIIASYDQVRLDYQEIARYVDFDLVVLDEAQKIKNPSSKTSLACRSLQRTRSWALSGTPLENRLDDLLSILHFVQPGLVHTGLGLTELHDKMRPVFLRRVKEDVFDELPEILLEDMFLELSGRQRSAYDELWQGRFTAQSEGELLGVLTRLKQVCNFHEPSGESAKLDTLQILVEQMGSSDRMIVFSQYVETIEWLRQRVKGAAVDLFHGGLDEKERDHQLRLFRTKPGPRVLLMSLHAGAAGLNLGEASCVVFYDRWWNPAVESQAMYRAYRFGRRVPLQVVRFLVTDTVEERIQSILQEKATLFRISIDDAESAHIMEYNGGDLRRILQLER